MQTQTICAKVNPKLLTKAQRLFTGTIEGRIIEIIQNARRAGATQVKITNKDNIITVRDNGKGIDDFSKLLDLGSSGWDEQIQSGEDPAGVGLFCLAPREVTIISGHSKAVIAKDGWTGEPVKVQYNDEFINGTILKFKDDKPWENSLVENNSVFSGLKITVDGKYCHSMAFCSEKAIVYPNPGCKIEIVSQLTKYHRNHISFYGGGRILVNFHGQLVQLDYWPVNQSCDISILVDIADSTDIRLMLPARTRLVQDDALERLKEAIELEFYRYIQSQKEHSLYYGDYLRAKQLGIELNEAKPQFRAGLIFDEYGLAVEAQMPDSLTIQDCYLMKEKDFKDDELDIANAHLLAALGKFNDNNSKPFLPITIDPGFIGYSWTNLAKVVDVRVIKGKLLNQTSISYGDIACFDSLYIRVRTSDDKTFGSDVPMAIVQEKGKDDKIRWASDLVCITKQAKDELTSDNIWFHLGGYNEEGDSFDTQQYEFQKELNEFFYSLIGPYESIRRELIGLMDRQYVLHSKWQKIIFDNQGQLEIVFKNGNIKKV